MSTHLWLTGPRATGAAAPETEPDVVVDCHRRLRGPYTGAGSLLRALAPRVQAVRPELLDRYKGEILALAPELRGLVPAPPETLTARAAPAERTRLHPPTRTRRIAHGVVDLLRSFAALDGRRPLVLDFAHADAADPTDQEFLALLLRRADPERLTVVVRTESDSFAARATPTPAGPPATADQLAFALREFALHVEAEPPCEGPGRNRAALAVAFVAGDGVGDDPRERAAYDLAAPEIRARLHDARAKGLQRRLRQGEFSLTLGALPYHLERGSDPAAALPVLLSAAEHALNHGYYHALLDLARRAQDLAGDDAPPALRLGLHTKAATALTLLGDTERAERLHLSLRERSADPLVHLASGYALAMLYTRFHPPERLDHLAAKALLHNTIALASLWPDPLQRAFHTTFQENGLALAETHLGRPAEALRLVEGGLERLRRELPDDSHLLHRSVLVHNRARVYTALGRLGDALADFDTVVAMDPHHAEHYMDRAGIRRRLGDTAGSVADYDRAVDLAPPHWEVHVNRADARLELGDTAGALADLRHAAELEPDQPDVRASLAGLLLDQGDLAGARAHIAEGLRHHPDDARLVCAHGLLALHGGDEARARADFDRALAADPALVSALAGRAALAHAAGDDRAALDDLTHAIALDGDDPDLLFNRGYVHQRAGRTAEARADYTAALELPGADPDELRRRIAECDTPRGVTAP
ncbi:tetratricopeptide repeat protein [Streptomyces silaceus]|uniref:tetratricopeptide repeat protein n=1 Tax=Streptomyces silaceus TaxID=545123 RepID=UPI0006EB8256|nr:tetratricopeptide repeat protein [Streptomyces silaceus]